MVLTAYPALSPATDSSCHRRQRIKVLQARSGSRTSADLTPATGARTTRLCRPQLAPLVLRDPDHSRAEARPAINSARRAAASTATRPNVRDDGQRPSYRNGIAKATTVSGFRKAFLASGLDTQISLNCLGKSTFARTRFGVRGELRAQKCNRFALALGQIRCTFASTFCPSGAQSVV